jgi:AcrR family transcriptional regulator
MPKIVDHDAYRKELLFRSLDLFVCRGYSALSIRHIAAELNVSTGTLYHYFKTKEELFLALLDEVRRKTFNDAAGYIAAQPQMDPLEAFCRYIEKNEEWLRKELLLVINVAQQYELYSKASHDMLKRAASFYRNGISKLLGKQNGQLASLFIGCVNGLLINKIFNDSHNFSEQIPLITNMIMRLKAQQEPL